MILAIHNDASYLSEPKARNRAGAQFVMSTDTAFLPNNGAIHSTAQIIKQVMSSAAEAKQGALYINIKLAAHIRLTLSEMGHSHQCLSTLIMQMHTM